VTPLYIDTSTLMRAFIAKSDEHHNAHKLIEAPGYSWLSSSLLRLEARRTAWMQINELGYHDNILKLTDAFITNRIALHKITDHVLLDAFTISQTIKSADAIHLATAKTLLNEVLGVVTSDKTMYRVGHEIGLNMLTVTQALALVPGA